MRIQQLTVIILWQFRLIHFTSIIGSMPSDQKEKNVFKIRINWLNLDENPNISTSSTVLAYGLLLSWWVYLTPLYVQARRSRG